MHGYSRYFTLLMLTACAAFAQKPAPYSTAGVSDTVSHGRPAPKPDSAVVNLDRMVVTATRTKRLISETPASVSIVSAEQIECSPAKNIDDLIATKSGIQVKRVVGIGEGVPSTIMIRGIPGAFGSSRILVLVDGIPTNASGTPFMILNEIPLDAIERVEIVRGPYSALYGANAFGGVVNVITKQGDGRPNALLSLESGYPFTLLYQTAHSGVPVSEALGGSVGTTYWNMQGQSSGGNERAGFLVSAGFRTIGDYLLRDYATNEKPDTTYILKNKNYDYRDIRLFGKGNVRISDKVGITLNARYFDSDLGFGMTRFLVPDSQDIITTGRKFLVGPSMDIRLTDRLDLTVGGYYRHLDGEFWNEKASDSMYITASETLLANERSYWKSTSNDWQVESRLLARVGSHQTLTAGIDYLRNAINFGAYVNPITGDTFPNSHGRKDYITNFGVFVQDEIVLFNRLNIVPGVRLDYHSTFGAAVSPKLGVSWKAIDMLRLRGSVGRAFEAPTLSQLYMPDLTINPSFVLRPNPDLTPEYLWAADAAVELTPLKSLRLQVGGFYNDMRDLIVPKVMPDKAVSHANVSDSWSTGLELEGEYQVVPSLTLSAGYVFQQSRDVYATKIRSKFAERDTIVPLDYVPAHSATAELRFHRVFRHRTLNVTFSEAYVGYRRYQDWTAPDSLIGSMPDNGTGEPLVMPPLFHLPAYWRTDAMVKLRFSSYLWAAFSIQNMFNVLYEENAGTLASGRFATFKIGAEF
jgi:outer membrane receptor protein involved in Fe transport